MRKSKAPRRLPVADESRRGGIPMNRAVDRPTPRDYLGWIVMTVAQACRKQRLELRPVVARCVVIRRTAEVEDRSLVEKAGVPVLPTHRGPPASLRRAAERLGTPLFIKAAAGGGGRGIRRLEDLARVEELARSASRVHSLG